MSRQDSADAAEPRFHRFNDPDAFVAAMPLSEQRFQIGRIRDYSGSIMSANIGSFRVSRGEATIGAAMRGGIGPRCTFIIVAIPGTERVLDRHGSPYGTMYHPTTDDLYRCHGSPHPAAWLGLSIDHDVLTSVTAALSGRDLAPSREAALYTRVPGEALQRLISVGNRIARLAEHTPDRLRHTALSAALNGVLDETLTQCLDGSPTKPDTASARRQRLIMKRLDAIGEKYPDEPLTLTQLCQMTGVNQRTLHLASHQFANMGPVDYLRSFRLTRVRRALTEADPRQTSVGDAAAAFGFWELGRFAAVYRATFGELPSETLRRAR